MMKMQRALDGIPGVGTEAEAAGYSYPQCANQLPFEVRSTVSCDSNPMWTLARASMG
jgi:hypothetical protein